MRKFTQAIVIAAVACGAAPARANGYLESGSWQFATPAERSTSAYIAAMIEQKRAGYYNSYHSTNYNTTNINKQVNCTQTATSTGSAGQNSLTASTSSPVLNASAALSSSAAANRAANTTASGFMLAGQPLNSTQSNTGAVASNVTGSSASTSGGTASSNDGTSSQVLNSTQTNQGAQTASLTGSTACAGN